MNNAARRVARWLLLIFPIAISLAFSRVFSPPFSAPKNAILVMTACVLMALGLVSFSGRKPPRGEWPFWIAVAVYVAINAFSAVISQKRSMCIESVVLLVCGVLLFWGSLAALDGEGRAANVHNLQTAITAAAIAVSLATLAHFFRMGEVGIDVNSSDRMRMTATLGNPDFVAAFLAVALPAAIGLGMTAKRLRAFWISAAMLIGAAIVLTGSRAGLMAAAVGVAVVAFALRRKRALMLAAVVVACALACGTQLNSRTPWESLRGRVFIWQVSLSDGAARSALGSGPGTFAFDYPLKLGRFFAEPGREPLLHFAGHERHAQNDFVEGWHDTGWLGLGSLLALLGLWFTAAIRRLRERDDEARPAIAAAIASVCALCAASLFDFPMHRAETWALLWILMAVPLIPSTKVAVPKHRRAWLRYAGAALLLIAGSYFAFAPLAASYELAKGETAEKGGDSQASRAAYQSALQWDPSSPDANFDLVRADARMGDYPGALAQSKIAVGYVNEPELHILRSRILQVAGQEGEARLEVESAIRLFPYSVQLREEEASFSFPDAEPQGH